MRGYRAVKSQVSQFVLIDVKMLNINSVIKWSKVITLLNYF